MPQRLLEGDVLDADDSALELGRLREELGRVSRERDALRAENVRLRQRVNQVDAPVAQLRQTLEPLYRALQAVWGEIEVIDPQTVPATAVGGNAQPQKHSAVWESWKAKMGGAAAKVITALQEHGEATSQQLTILCHIQRK